MLKWVVDSFQVRGDHQGELIIEEEYYVKTLYFLRFIPIWSKEYDFSAAPEKDKNGNIVKKEIKRKIGF